MLARLDDQIEVFDKGGPERTVAKLTPRISIAPPSLPPEKAGSSARVPVTSAVSASLGLQRILVDVVEPGNVTLYRLLIGKADQSRQRLAKAAHQALKGNDVPNRHRHA